MIGAEPPRHTEIPRRGGRPARQTIPGQARGAYSIESNGQSRTRPGTGYRYRPWPAGCSAWASRLPSRRTWPRAGRTVRSERWSRPGQRPASSARMSFWSGSSAPPGPWNVSHRQSIAAKIRRARLRRVPSRSQPLTADSPARATAVRSRRTGGRRVSPPDGQPTPADARDGDAAPQAAAGNDAAVAAYRLSVNSRQSALRTQARPGCSDAPPAAGHVPGSPMHGNHRSIQPGSAPGNGTQTPNRPFTRSTATNTARASCTDGTDHRIYSTRCAGTIRQPGPRPRPLRPTALLLCVTSLRAIDPRPRAGPARHGADG